MSATLADTAARAAPGAADLSMVRLPLDARRLMQFGHAHRLFGSPREQDEGYLVHALFAALFGSHAPKPFALPAPGERRAGEIGIVTVLAYASDGIERLRAEASAFADPGVYAVVRWEETASKPMPHFAPGSRLGFELRASPLRRLGRGAPSRPPRPRSSPHHAGAEVDAYQAEWLAAEESAGVAARADIYAAWLAEQFAASRGACLLGTEMIAFLRSRLTRRGRPEADNTRPLRAIERPDARFGGALEVTDPEAFHRFLARGVGRHRAFGFGMLLLRRAPGGA